MHVQQVPAERKKIMITEYLVAMYNSVRTNGRRRGSRVALVIDLSPTVGALIAPVSTTWSNYIVLGPEHSLSEQPASILDDTEVDDQSDWIYVSD